MMKVRASELMVLTFAPEVLNNGELNVRYKHGMCHFQLIMAQIQRWNWNASLVGRPQITLHDLLQKTKDDYVKIIMWTNHGHPENRYMKLGLPVFLYKSEIVKNVSNMMEKY